MSVEKTPWWKDARFLIPAVIVPVVLAVIPQLLDNDSASDELSVDVFLSDARRPSASIVDASFSRGFQVSQSTGSAMARVIADELAADVRQHLEPVLAGREPMTVTVRRASDGILFIDGSLRDTVALHVTRFAPRQVRSLDDIVLDPTVQRTLPANPDLSTEGLQADLQLRAGVYRAVLTAPGYREAWRLLELTQSGELLTPNEENVIGEAAFPLEFELQPQFSRPPRIAVSPCESVPAANAEPRFQDFGPAVTGALAAALDRSEGLSAVTLGPGERVGFDVNATKNLPPPEGLVRADLVIEACRVEWI